MRFVWKSIQSSFVLILLCTVITGCTAKTTQPAVISTATAMAAPSAVSTFGPSEPVQPALQLTPTQVTAGSCLVSVILAGEKEQSSGLQSGLTEAAESKACRVEINAIGSDADAMAAQIAAAVQKSADGIILIPLSGAVSSAVEGAVQQALDAGIPVISIGVEAVLQDQTSQVIPDAAGGAQKAASFLCQALHERGRVLELTEPGTDRGQQISAAFEQQFRAVCPEAELVSISLKDTASETARQAVSAELAGNSDVAGVFSPAGSGLTGAMQAFDEQGVLGVVSAYIKGDTLSPSADLPEHADGVVQTPANDLGKAAMDALLNSIQGKKTRVRVEVPMDVRTSEAGFSLPPDFNARRVTIGVVLPEVTSDFYEQMYTGLLTTGRSLDNVSLKIRSAGGDPQKFIQILDGMIAAKVDAILVAPTQDETVIQAVAAAGQQGVPIITVGYPIPDGKLVSQIRFDDYGLGYRAGEYLCSAMGSQGTLADLYSPADKAAEQERTAGLQAYIQDKCAGIKIVTQKLAPDETKACADAADLVAGATPFTGVFAHSDALALCTVSALEANSKSAVVVGNGETAEAIESIRAGKLNATIGQYPSEMGTIAMETVIEYLYDKPIEADKPFPVNVITKETLK